MRKFALLVILVPFLVLASDVSEWDTSAANNNSAPPNGAPEGMAPSTVNDVMREVMAAVARWYSDTDGTLASGGAGNAYTLTTNSTHAALADQSMLVFQADRANTGAATLNVDGLGAKTMRVNGDALASGQIVADKVLLAVYNATDDAYDVYGVSPLVNNADWSGTDLAVANGGTGASDASGARTALGVAIGSDVQAFDADLTTLGGLAKTDSNFIVGNGSAWVAESGSTVRTSLGLGALATISSINNGNWSGTDLAVANGGTGASDASGARTALGVAIGSDVQAFDADLTTLGGLAKTDGNFIVGNGSAWVAESGATVRNSLSLGTGDSPQFTAVNLGAASDTTVSRDSAGKLAVEGRAIFAHDDAAYVSARIIVTNTTPTDTTGMASGDIKLVY